jgi:hypothetical protein
MASKKNEGGRYLLSNDDRIMTGLHLKGTVICPQIHRVTNRSHSALVNLHPSEIYLLIPRPCALVTYHFCRFSAGNVELEVGIALPVHEKEWELCEETVVDRAGG